MPRFSTRFSHNHHTVTTGGDQKFWISALGPPPNKFGQGVKGEAKLMQTFSKPFALLKRFFYSLNLLSVKGIVLGIEPKKILSPVPSL